MALINCRECGREVSDQAPACPHCGCPIGGPVWEGNPQPPPQPVVSQSSTREVGTFQKAFGEAAGGLCGCFFAIGVFVLVVIVLAALGGR
jgi:hypothetical protein